MTVQLIECAAADELAAAYALGAVDPAEERAIGSHLETCANPHAEARQLIGAAALIPASLEPVEPSPGLRHRLMSTVAATPQEHRPAREPIRQHAAPVVVPRTPWWRISPLPAGLAAVGLAAAVGLGAWGYGLNTELNERDAALRAIASADVIHPVSGEAGSGWLVESGDEAMFMAEGLAKPPTGQLYELWLIHADGTVLAVGTMTDTDDWTLVTLERGVGNATVFAVTAEAERVDAPTSEPVLTAPLDT